MLLFRNNTGAPCSGFRTLLANDAIGLKRSATGAEKKLTNDLHFIGLRSSREDIFLLSSMEQQMKFYNT